ncbi:MAG: sigma-70 family RNA polymerase sigma factor [Planctomycetota bacterium]
MSEAFLLYSNRLILLAQSRLDAATCQKVAPEEVVQSVYRSFCRRESDGELELVTPDSLWCWLAQLTVWKCKDRVKHHRAGRRDVRREQAPSKAGELGPASEGVSREPTPEEAAVLAETVEQLMQKLDECDRPILTLRLQGYTVPEIAPRVNCGERTVERVLARVRTWLALMMKGA